MNETFKINGRDYPITGYIKDFSSHDEMIPIVGLTMMSDQRWYELTKQNAVENYTKIWGRPPDNVEEAVAWQRDLCEKTIQRLYANKQAAWPPPYPTRVVRG